jgi:hypothetical protein
MKLCVVRYIQIHIDVIILPFLLTHASLLPSGMYIYVNRHTISFTLRMQTECYGS